MQHTKTRGSHWMFLGLIGVAGCGLDSLPDEGTNDSDSRGGGSPAPIGDLPDIQGSGANAGDGDIVLYCGELPGCIWGTGGLGTGGQSGELVLGTGGQPAPVGGAGALAGTGDQAVVLCDGDCPWYVGQGTVCHDRGDGHATCQDQGDGDSAPYCLFGHDGYGNCYPQDGCDDDVPFYEGDDCASDPDGNDYCDSLAIGHAIGRAGGCHVALGAGPAGDGPCERDYAVCFEMELVHCDDVSSCEAGREACLVDYDACIIDAATCGDQVSRCFSTAESCFSKLGTVAICDEHYDFCLSLAEDCAD